LRDPLVELAEDIQGALYTKNGSSFENEANIDEFNARIFNELHRVVCGFVKLKLLEIFHTEIAVSEKINDLMSPDEQGLTMQIIEEAIYIPGKNFNIKNECQRLAMYISGRVNAVLIELLQNFSEKDFLTGLDNRRAWTQKLQNILNRRLYQKCSKPVSVVIIDIDHFKNVNDHHSHLTGDLVLKQLAMLMQQHFRAQDVIGRYGGEEFIVILEIDGSVAYQAVERFRLLVKSTSFNTAEGDHIQLTISAGISNAHSHPDGPCLLTKADEAMYFSKRNGRNKVTLI